MYPMYTVLVRLKQGCGNVLTLRLPAFKTSLGPLIYFIYWSENIALSNVVRVNWWHLLYICGFICFLLLLREVLERSESGFPPSWKNCTKFQNHIPNGSMSKMFPISCKGHVSFVSSEWNSQVSSSPEIKLFWFLCFELKTHLYQYLNPLLGP